MADIKGPGFRNIIEIYIEIRYRILSKRYKKVEILTGQLTVPSLTLVFPDCFQCPNTNTGQNNLDIIATKNSTGQTFTTG